MDELRASIRDQEQLISDTYANEYEMAKAREGELASAVAKLDGQARVNSQAQVTMRELESPRNSANTVQQLFTEIKKINTLQTESLPIESARIITKAAPRYIRVTKRALLSWPVACYSGFFSVRGRASRKMGRRRVSNAESGRRMDEHTVCNSAQNRTEARHLPQEWRAKSARGIRARCAVLALCKSLRNIKALISAAQIVEGAKVIGIVSSVSGEGKTTIAANLAALIVASSGARTLLVDSDVHLRRLTHELAPNARRGLIEALVEPTRLDFFVCQRRSGLDVLPCVLPSRVPNAAEKILGSPKMEMLIAAASKTYDYIIIEIAPITAVTDIKLIEQFVDKFVFIVESGPNEERRLGGVDR